MLIPVEVGGLSSEEKKQLTYETENKSYCIDPKCHKDLFEKILGITNSNLTRLSQHELGKGWWYNSTEGLYEGNGIFSWSFRCSVLKNQMQTAYKIFELSITDKEYEHYAKELIDNFQALISGPRGLELISEDYKRSWTWVRVGTELDTLRTFYLTGEKVKNLNILMNRLHGKNFASETKTRVAEKIKKTATIASPSIPDAPPQEKYKKFIDTLLLRKTTRTEEKKRPQSMKLLAKPGLDKKFFQSSPMFKRLEMERKKQEETEAALSKESPAHELDEQKVWEEKSRLSRTKSDHIPKQPRLNPGEGVSSKANEIKTAAEKKKAEELDQLLRMKQKEITPELGPILGKRRVFLESPGPCSPKVLKDTSVV